MGNFNETSREKIDIEIGEVKESVIDYSKSIVELTTYYDERLALIQQGRKELANFELMMLGYGIDFIHWAKEVVDMDLTLKKESLHEFDGILEGIYNLCKTRGLKEEHLNDLLKKASAYFGLLILSKYKGAWVDTNIGPAVQVNGINAFVYNHIGRRLQSGGGDNVIVFYQLFEESIGKNSISYEL